MHFILWLALFFQCEGFSQLNQHPFKISSDNWNLQLLAELKESGTLCKYCRMITSSLQNFKMEQISKEDNMTVLLYQLGNGPSPVDDKGHHTENVTVHLNHIHIWMCIPLHCIIFRWLSIQMNISKQGGWVWVQLP